MKVSIYLSTDASTPSRKLLGGGRHSDSGWMVQGSNAGRAEDLPCRSGLLHNMYLVSSCGKSPGRGANHPLLQPESVAAIPPPSLCDCTATSRGRGGLYLYLLGRRVGGTYTVWTTYCPCLD